MSGFLLFVILVSGALSLVSYLYCWHDIKRGKPHIISLRQITGIMDRNRLDSLLGRHDGRYFYNLSPDVRTRLLNGRREFVYGECAADLVCMLGAGRYFSGAAAESTQGWFILIAGLCQAINFAYSTHLVRKWSHQIREEIDRE